MNERSRSFGWEEPTELAAVADPPFEVFFEREKAELYSVLCVVTRDRLEAEELTQDAFVRLLERWDRVGKMADPRGFSSEEAGRILGIRASTVRMHVSRAHAALKDAMADE